MRIETETHTETTVRVSFDDVPDAEAPTQAKTYSRHIVMRVDWMAVTFRDGRPKPYAISFGGRRVNKAGLGARTSDHWVPADHLGPDLRAVLDTVLARINGEGGETL